jgi:hypothetical protein
MKLVIEENDIIRYARAFEEKDKKKLQELSESWRSLVEVESELCRLNLMQDLAGKIGIITLLKYELYNGYGMNYHSLRDIDEVDLAILSIKHGTIFQYLLKTYPAIVNIP